MRMMGVVALLLAVAVLLVSVSKAKGHRHDEPGCSCCDAVVGVESSASSFDTALGSDVELTSTNERILTTNLDELEIAVTKTAPRREAGLRHVAASTSTAADLYDRESGPVVLGVGV